MQIVNFAVTPGVLDRTVFTKRGPLVKKPLILAQGTDLRIESPQQIFIPSGFFDSTHEGKRIDILGTPDGRNDGRFYIAEVLSPQRLVLEASDFDISDVAQTTARIVASANALREAFNSHTVQPDVHSIDDIGNEVLSPPASDLASACTLLIELRAKFTSHLVAAGVHVVNDTDNGTFSRDPDSLGSAGFAIQELLYKYNSHRNARDWHMNRDSINRTSTGFRPVLGTGPQVGVFSWQLWDPRFGQIADNSSDVRAFVNGTPVAVEAVYGLHRAVVLQSAWNDGDVVTIDYEWMYDPPVQIGELNNWGFVLNQDENRSFGGFLEQPVKFRSYLADPSRYNLGLIRSKESPYTAGWKYKAYERAYLSALQDPTLLLLNTPFNRVSNPTYKTNIVEQSVSYDPVRQPTEDGWTRTGTGIVELSDGTLVVHDEESGAHSTRNVNFFSHPINMDYPSQIFTAWRFSVDPPAYDGSFSGVGFGLCDGSKLILAGCVLTEATNLSSACQLANTISTSFNAHITESGIHSPNDPTHSVIHAKAETLPVLTSLLNSLKYQFNEHIQIGPDFVHNAIDTSNVVSFVDLSVDFATLEQALAATNELWQAFNAHLVHPTIHYKSDTINTCPLVRQIGLLTRPQLEFSASWESFAHDWSKLSTIRLERDSSGSARLFVPGEVEPRVIIPADDLPFISDVDLELPQFESTFFGSLGDEARSVSRWERIRINNIPDVSFQFVDRKLVSYSASTLPENSPSSPWNHIGLSGSSYLQSGLVVDNTAYVPSGELPDYGLLTGNYQGFVRVEPILQSDVITICDFSARILTWTFGIGTLAQGVYINYRDLAVPFVFLQSDPTPAVVDGTTTEPFSIQSGESFSVVIDSGSVYNIVFPSPLSTAAAAATEINNQLGVVLAYDIGGKLRFQSVSRGSTSTIELRSGSALPRFGILPGVYRGLDTDPEPRISYSGADFPDRVSPVWTAYGDLPVRMLGRELQIQDASLDSFQSYTLSDVQVMQPVISSSVDWKANIRMCVESSVAGSPITTGSNLLFCGALVNFEEGQSGKSVDFQLSQSTSGTPYVSIYSYNPTTDNLESVSEFAFNWKDGEFHTYNIYTNKTQNLVFVLADNQLLGSFSYSSLQNSSGTPLVTFGTGGNPASNGDLHDARSITRWENVSVARDSKISDPSSAGQRYIGIYHGGDPKGLSSYAVHAIDWTSSHNYRIVCDPSQSVTVYVDGQASPCISVGYNSLSLPSSQSSFLHKVTNGRTAIAFGGFDSQELSRSVWSNFTYSMRKSGDSQNLMAPHQVLNYANVMASPDHLFTQVDHLHYGFKISSSGVPNDDFMGRADVPSYTQLLEGTPPVPATQNLENRGGLIRSTHAIATETVPDIFLENGGLHSYSDDVQNSIDLSTTQTQALQLLLTNTNTIRSTYISHIANTTAHIFADVDNTVLDGPCVDLTSAIDLLNVLRAKYEAHRVQITQTANPSNGVHNVADVENTVSAPIASDLDSALVLCQNLAVAYEHHVFMGQFHRRADYENYSFEPNTTSLADAQVALTQLKAMYNAHRATASTHQTPDSINVVTAADPTDLATSRILAIDLRDKFIAHKASTFHAITDSDHNLTQPVSITSDVSQLLNFVNDFKKAYGGHVLSTPVHTSSRVDQTMSGALNTVSPQHFTNVILNDLKARFNSHQSNATLHLASGTPISTPDATGLPSSIALAEAIRVAINAHSTSGTAHQTIVATNIAPITMTTLDHVIDLTQQLHEIYSSHIDYVGVHGKSDNSTPIPGPTATNLADAFVILNAVKADFNLHRLRPQIHKVSDTTYAVTTGDATDANSARLLSTALRNAIRGHVSSSQFHNVGALDDDFVENDGTVSTLLVLTEQIRVHYNAHLTRAIMGTRVHGLLDTVNLPSNPSPGAWVATSIQYLQSKYNAHLQSDAHYTDGRLDSTQAPVIYSSVTVNIPSILQAVQEMTASMRSHFGRWDGVSELSNLVHRIPDSVGQSYLNFAPINTIHRAIVAINDLNLSYDLHIGGNRIHQVGADFSLPDVPMTSMLSYLVGETEKTVIRVNSHFQLRDSHPELTSEFVLSGVRDAAWVVSTVNALKIAVNDHTSSNFYHVVGDSANVIVDADATDLNTASDLLVAIQSAFNAHRTQSGVHGNLVMIEMSVPNRVLYNAIKFFIIESGEKNLVSSIAEEIHGIEVENTTLNSVTLRLI